MSSAVMKSKCVCLLFGGTLQMLAGEGSLDGTGVLV